MPVPCAAITRKRLADWAKRCGPLHCTPLMMLTIGHDHNSPELGIMTVEDVTDAELIRFLDFALRELLKKGAKT